MSINTVLTDAEKLAIRELQAAYLSVQLKSHEFRSTVEAQFQKIIAEVKQKETALIVHVQTLAKNAGHDIEAVLFNFDKLAFEPNPNAPVPAPLPPTPDADKPPVAL